MYCYFFYNLRCFQTLTFACAITREWTVFPYNICAQLNDKKHSQMKAALFAWTIMAYSETIEQSSSGCKYTNPLCAQTFSVVHAKYCHD